MSEEPTYESMATFRQSFGEMAHKTTSAEYYRWKAEGNPFGRGTLHLVKRDGVVAGSGSLTPKRVLVRGESTLAAEIGDTYTNPQFRRQGIFASAVQACTQYAMENGVQFIYGTPNDAALPGYETKLNYRQVPGVRVAVLTKYLSASAVAARLRERLPAAARGAARSLALTYLAGRDARIRLSHGRVAGGRLAFVADYPQTDGRWGSSRQEYTFFTLRDTRYLDWRFRQNPDSYQVCSAMRAGHSVGYIVSKFFQRGTHRVAAICDFVTTSDDRATFRALLATAQSRFREQETDVCELWCATTSPYFRWLTQAGFIQRTSFPVIIYAGSPAADRLLAGSQQWHFTLGDSDNI